VYEKKLRLSLYEMDLARNRNTLGHAVVKLSDVNILNGSCHYLCRDTVATLSLVSANLRTGFLCCLDITRLVFCCKKCIVDRKSGKINKIWCFSWKNVFFKASEGRGEAHVSLYYDQDKEKLKIIIFAARNLPDMSGIDF